MCYSPPSTGAHRCRRLSGVQLCVHQAEAALRDLQLLLQLAHPLPLGLQAAQTALQLSP